MRDLFDTLARHHSGVDTLSMGMSEDFVTAIEHGATMVRVGSALFGPRGLPQEGVPNQGIPNQELSS